MEYPEKEVYFEIYCKSCKHANKFGSDEPCNECLTIGHRENSHKPEYYEENK